MPPDRSTVTDGERLNLHVQQQSKQRPALPPPQVRLQNGSSGADRDVLKKPEGGAETSMYVPMKQRLQRIRTCTLADLKSRMETSDAEPLPSGGVACPCTDRLIYTVTVMTFVSPPTPNRSLRIGHDLI